MLIEININPLFANNDGVEDGNGDGGREMDFCIEVDSTYNLSTWLALKFI